VVDLSDITYWTFNQSYKNLMMVYHIYALCTDLFKIVEMVNYTFRSGICYVLIANEKCPWLSAILK